MFLSVPQQIVAVADVLKDEEKRRMYVGKQTCCLNPIPLQTSEDKFLWSFPLACNCDYNINPNFLPALLLLAIVQILIVRVCWVHHLLICSTTKAPIELDVWYFLCLDPSHTRTHTHKHYLIYDFMLVRG